ncbi:hypothetical protein AS19_05360 [Alcanivorax sp. NBRC 101098]|nr:hypothetical protein AS19_05360 [Alcanivorax sp. NBRC 101098]
MGALAIDVEGPVSVAGVVVWLAQPWIRRAQHRGRIEKRVIKVGMPIFCFGYHGTAIGYCPNLHVVGLSDAPSLSALTLF